MFFKLYISVLDRFISSWAKSMDCKLLAKLGSDADIALLTSSSCGHWVESCNAMKTRSQHGRCPACFDDFRNCKAFDTITRNSCCRLWEHFFSTVTGIQGKMLDALKSYHANAGDFLDIRGVRTSAPSGNREQCFLLSSVCILTSWSIICRRMIRPHM